jgi:hypothetical protein
MSELQRALDRIEELEEVLGIDRSMTNRIRGALGVSRDQAKMLGLLISRNIVTHTAMFTVLYGARPDCDQPATKIMDVQLCKLRRRLSQHGIAIKTEWGEGWAMSLGEKAKVRRLIAIDGARMAEPYMAEMRAA